MWQCFKITSLNGPLVYAVPDQKAIKLVELLTKEDIPLFGVPEALLSD